ncbi:protein of unknown function [Pseudomonas sp. JV241A]|nr:protein of unknown function [Pseudomonas sp. JV241A]
MQLCILGGLSVTGMCKNLLI